MNYLTAVRLFKVVEKKIPWHFNTYCLVHTLGRQTSWKSMDLKAVCFDQHRQVTTHTPGFINKQPSLFERIIKKIGYYAVAKSKLRASGYQLYETVADHIDYECFFKEFSLPDTFNSWFLITELHVWMLMVRCMAEEEGGQFTRNAIVESMWQDVTFRAKKLGSEHSSAAREQIKELSEQFQAALLSYDEGLQSDDRVLAGAIWRRFFSKQCDSPVLVENAVRYIRQQILFLDFLDKEMFLQRRFTWPLLNSSKQF